MLTVQPITHIRMDERGAAWIAETNVKVIEVAMDHAAYDWDAEEIHAAHPNLSLAHIHALYPTTTTTRQRWMNKWRGNWRNTVEAGMKRLVH